MTLSPIDYGSREFRDDAAPSPRYEVVYMVTPPPAPDRQTLAAIRAQCEARHAVDGGWRVRRRIDTRGLHRAMTLGELADYVADTVGMDHEVVVKTDPLNAAMLIVWTRPAVPQAVGLDALREADDAGDAADAIAAQDASEQEAA